jgi:hypothetical protein
MMTVQCDLLLQEMLERVFRPMIAVRMGQDRRANLMPAGAGAGKPFRQTPRTQAEVEQQSEPVGFQIAGVARAAAAKYAESQGHGNILFVSSQ